MTNKGIKEFKILDLFCGAGGFSYGMEKNSHFKTVVALDNDPFVGDTFKKNMPDCEVVIGDITAPAIHDTILKSSKSQGVNMIIGGPPCQGFSLWKHSCPHECLPPQWQWALRKSSCLQ